MPITNPTHVAFSNEKIRPAADRLAQTYYWAKQVFNEWTANGYSSAIPNSGSEEVIDGAQSDGRIVIHGDDIHNIVTRLSEFITDYEASSNAKLNTVLQVAVHVDP